MVTRDHELGVSSTLIVIVLKYDYLLEEAWIFNVSVIILFWVYNHVLNLHHEFIDLHFKGFSNFLSQVTKSLEVADTDLSPLVVISIHYIYIEGLNTAELLRQFHFWLQWLLAFISIKEFTNELNSISDYSDVMIIHVFHALLYELNPHLLLLLKCDLGIEFQM